jgi:hypothetical protein
VTHADWQRVGKPSGNTGRYSISIAANGHSPLADLGDDLRSVWYHRVTIGRVCTSATGVYSWKVTGRKLTLTKVHDRCANAAALLAGVWTRY